MGTDLKDKIISNNGIDIVLDWKNAEVVTPDNLQGKVGKEEKAKKESKNYNSTDTKTSFGTSLIME